MSKGYLKKCYIKNIMYMFWQIIPGRYLGIFMILKNHREMNHTYNNIHFTNKIFCPNNIYKKCRSANNCKDIE